MATEDIVIRFIIDDKRFTAAATQATQKLGFFERQAKQANKAFSSFVGNFTALMAVKGLRSIGNGIGYLVNNLRAFETALVGVGKTTNLSGKELENLGKQIQELSTQIPMATTELLNITKMAAQLGIRGTENLVKFTETVSKLASATNLSSEEAATSLAKLLNITNESVGEIDKLGAVIVDLGNNFATTERDIVNMSLEIARATGSFEVNSGEVAALSATLSSLGAQAEGSGSAIGNVFRKMAKSISRGGTSLELFAKLSGETVDQFKTSFEQDAFGAFTKFIGGLNKASLSGIGLQKVLIQLNLTELRTRKTIEPLIGRYDLLANALSRYQEQIKNPIALNKEAEARSQTLDSQLTILKNTFDAVSQSAGGPFVKSMTNAVKSFSTFIGTFGGEDTLVGINAQINTLKNNIIDLQNKISNPIAGGKFTEDFRQELRNTQIELAQLENRKIRLEFELLPPNEQQIKRIETNIATMQLKLNNEQNTNVQMRYQKQIDAWNKELIALKGNIDAKKTLKNDADIEEDAKQQAKLQKSYEFENRLLELQQQAIIAKAGFTTEELNNHIAFVDAKYKIEKDALDKIQEEYKAKGLSTVDIQKKVNDLNLKKKRETNVLLEESDEKMLKGVGESFGALADLAKLGGEKTFKVMKALQTASVITSGIAAVSAAASAVPYPANIPGILVETARAATNLAAVQATNPSFAQGGIVPGNSYSGDKVTANVNSAEMILNRRQQANLFNIANGGQQPGRPQEIVVHTTVELDGEAIGKSVSRQVADGLKLGENI